MITDHCTPLNDREVMTGVPYTTLWGRIRPAIDVCSATTRRATAHARWRHPLRPISAAHCAKQNADRQISAKRH